MNRLKYFLDCYFNQGEGFDDLDRLIQEFKAIENDACRFQFITELHQIMQTKNYELASRIMKKYGSRILNLEKTEKFINFLYDRLIDRPTNVKPQDFKRNVKVVLCPVCCPNPEKVTAFNLIEKATIVKNNQQIFICKPCKLVWLSEDIQADNAQDYKKFMKTLGLKGLWKELSDVDTL